MPMLTPESSHRTAAPATSIAVTGSRFLISVVTFSPRLNE
jgi:hypothetical protein